MLTQYEIPAYFISELPEMIYEFKYIFPSMDIHDIIQCLTNYTTRRIMQHDLENVNKSLIAAEHIFCQGNMIVKAAIESVFVYSLIPLIGIWNNENEQELQSFMPMHLRTVYMQQMLKLKT